MVRRPKPPVPENPRLKRWEILLCVGSPVLLLVAGTMASFLTLGAFWKAVLGAVQLLAILALDAGLVMGVVRTRRLSFDNLLRVLVLLAVTADTVIRLSWLFS